MSQKALGNLKKGRVFVVSAPAGTGKTTLVHMLVKEFACVIQSISYTTRPPRPGEVNGKDYYFVTEEEFNAKIQEGAFLEHVKLYGFYYGTSRLWVEEQLKQGKHVVLVIDTQGGLQLLRKFPATFIFIKPPSLDALKQRLIARQTETSAMLATRLDRAAHEIEDGQSYHYQIINEDLPVAYDILRSILIAEEHKT